ncbi:hypothetical protein [Kitasatospora sp. NPDC089509]|uniref:hypothetical protein n=1 Tax=Kitasatospora sp. NPDC089509 TaxID=3364079 RepID=UPI0037F55404
MKAKKTMRRTAMAAAAGALALAGTVASAGTAQADSSVSMREPGILYQGSSLNTDDTRLILQLDGNLVIYRNYQTPNPVAVWSAAGTWSCGYKAIMQGDGNFVVYNASNKVCWASNTFKSDPNSTASLVVSDHGGLTVQFSYPPRASTATITVRSTDLY